MSIRKHLQRIVAAIDEHVPLMRFMRSAMISFFIGVAVFIAFLFWMLLVYKSKGGQ
ncbi:MAG: hypothetical protein ACOCWQ_00990 [Nanoarchaeota archaeon]